jgi:hypothetical protein
MRYSRQIFGYFLLRSLPTPVTVCRIRTTYVAAGADEDAVVAAHFAALTLELPLVHVTGRPHNRSGAPLTFPVQRAAASFVYEAPDLCDRVGSFYLADAFDRQPHGLSGGSDDPQHRSLVIDFDVDEVH